MSPADAHRFTRSPWLAGSVLTALTAPLLLFGAQPLELGLGKYQIRGTLDDYAKPYLAVTAVLGLGALGLGAIGAAGSTGMGLGSQPPLEDGPKTPMASVIPVSVSPSAAQLAEAQISLLSEERLRISGLAYFLEDDDSPEKLLPQAQVESSKERPVAPKQLADPLAAASPEAPVFPAGTPLSHSSSSTETVLLSSAIAAIAPELPFMAVTPTVTRQNLPSGVISVQTMLPAAQNYMSFVRSHDAAIVMSHPALRRDLSDEMIQIDQLHQMREHLLSLMNQIDQIQASLEQTSYPIARPTNLRSVAALSYVVANTEPTRAIPGASQVSWQSRSAIAS